MTIGVRVGFANNPGEFFVTGLLKSGHAAAPLSGNPIVDLGSEWLEGRGSIETPLFEAPHGLRVTGLL